ncbi:hypothetical protein ACSVDA_04875 [Cytobacillus sp. Hm23]
MIRLHFLSGADFLVKQFREIVAIVTLLPTLIYVRRKDATDAKWLYVIYKTTTNTKTAFGIARNCLHF